MEDKKGGFFSEIKNQIVTGIGLVITAAFGLLIANMQSIFEPKEEKVEPPVMEQRINVPSNTKDTVIVTKTIVIPPKEKKKEEDISW
tara:strand:+ start:2919 stop:3179 length:261 start_codon:yes stop_codon:yes gene_type:complete